MVSSYTLAKKEDCLQKLNRYSVVYAAIVMKLRDFLVNLYNLF